MAAAVGKDTFDVSPLGGRMSPSSFVPHLTTPHRPRPCSSSSVLLGDGASRPSALTHGEPAKLGKAGQGAAH
eukprot:gene14443-53921_t